MKNFNEIKKILITYDPVGLINMGFPKNEYDDEAELLLQMMKEKQNLFMLTFKVYFLFIKRFDWVTAGSIFRYYKIAKELNGRVYDR